MKDIVLIKIYGHFRPAGQSLAAQAADLCRAAVPAPPAGAVALDGDLLGVAYEGICFPVRELLDCLERGLSPAASGRLDVLDLENWRLDRHEYLNGRFICKSAPLNSVLDYSGF